MALLLLIHWLFVLSLFGGGGGGAVIGPFFAMHYLVAFWFCNHLVDYIRNSWFFYFNGLLASNVDCLGSLCLFFTMSWVGLQCVIVAFPGHTYSFFKVHYT